MSSDLSTTLNPVANSIRGLAMDGVQQANSGHPGMPLGMADVASLLWARYLKFDPQRPSWQIVTALFCPPGMAACCCMPSCI